MADTIAFGTRMVAAGSHVDPGFWLECWNVLLELSPWLLLGMLISGVLHVLLPEDFIRRKFYGTGGVIRAVALGVPLPLCSCGVIPAGVGLRNQGADDGSAIGFLISTPQTGVDSIFVSSSFFGWPFAIFKMAAALLLGVVGGLIANALPKQDKSGSAKLDVQDAEPAAASDCCGGMVASQLEEAAANEASDCCSSGNSSNHGAFARFFAHTIEVFHSIWLWLAIGVLISAAISAWIPDSWLQSVGAYGSAPAMMLVLLISTPLYICATASVPLAAALVAGGFPPSAALVLLMAGPATNTATMGAIYGTFGTRLLAIYLAVVLIGSMASGFAFDWLLSESAVANLTGHPDHGGVLEVGSAIVVIGLMLQCMTKWFNRDDSRTIEEAQLRRNA